MLKCDMQKLSTPLTIVEMPCCHHATLRQFPLAAIASRRLQITTKTNNSFAFAFNPDSRIQKPCMYASTNQLLPSFSYFGRPNSTRHFEIVPRIPFKE
jgi:hypothetical protein